METIRTAQLEDCAAIAHVHVESWRTTYKDLVSVEHHQSYDQRLRLWQQVLSVPSREGVTLVAIVQMSRIRIFSMLLLLVGSSLVEVGLTRGEARRLGRDEASSLSTHLCRCPRSLCRWKGKCVDERWLAPLAT
jgi:hypothetical protein